MWDLDDVEIKCAYDGCGKMSKIDLTEKISSYIKSLEDTISEYKIKIDIEREKRITLENKRHSIKTLTGNERLVYNTEDSIQWAVSPMK